MYYVGVSFFPQSTADNHPSEIMTRKLVNGFVWDVYLDGEIGVDVHYTTTVANRHYDFWVSGDEDDGRLASFLSTFTPL